MSESAIESTRPLRVLVLSAEVVPFAKTGGLADVAGALPKALRELGHDVRVCMPRYSRIEPERFQLEKVLENIEVPIDSTCEAVSVLQGEIGRDIPVYMIDHEGYFGREGLYGYPDDGERFILYCRAALEAVRRLDWAPDIVHCHDWHTAIVPNWLKTIYRDDPFFGGTASVYTIHNLQYQGVFGKRILEIAGIDAYEFDHQSDLSELGNVVDLMARGIRYADIISTVSERYAEEVLTPEFGERLDPILRERREHLHGVLNGLDYDQYSPATDQFISQRFDIDSLEKRVRNKHDLQREAALPERANVPLIGMVSRLVDQKGFDILSEAYEAMMTTLDLQFVLLGTGDQHYHNVFTNLRQRYPDKTSIFLTFNASLAQKIYAGSDMFLMPSLFEPCGLGQMAAMRYGSVPIVRSTGGLADTVEDVDPRRDVGNGFVFERYDAMSLFAAVTRAVETYKYKEQWQRIQRRGMERDFSWAASARRYTELYRLALSRVV